MIEISRKAYCDMYGPTVGDRVRLGDTSLIAEVEKDLTVHGDEAKFEMCIRDSRNSLPDREPI